MALHFRSCNLCEACCGIVIEHDGGKITSIKGDKEDPLSRGYICPKASALGQIYEDPDRLRAPVKRVGDKWHEISWDEALDETAERIKQVQAKYGRNAVAGYFGNPIAHNYGSSIFGMGFFQSLHTRNRFTSTTADQLPRMLVSLWMYGSHALLPIPDIDRTDYMIALGANPLVSNGSIMTAPGMPRRLTELRERGGKLVVIDPRRTETAQFADEHHFIRPSADAWFLLAMLNVMFAEKLVNIGRLEKRCVGLDEVAKAVEGYTPARAAKVCDIKAADIKRLAREFAGAKSAVLYGRVGSCTQRFGGLATWAIDLINILSGNFDSPGGVMFPKPVVDLAAIANRAGITGSFGRYKSRVRGLPEYTGEIPVSTLADEIKTPGEGQVRALVTAAANPVLSAPNAGRIDNALAGLDFMASIDVYISETTRHAHIILPPTHVLERENFDVVFQAVMVRNYTKFQPALFDPPAGALHDWEIFLELTRRMGGKTPFQTLGQKLTGTAALKLGPERLMDIGIRLGPYGDRFNPFSKGLNLRKVKMQPHGMDLGAHGSRIPELLATKGGKILLAPKVVLEDLARLDTTASELKPARGKLLLVSRRDLRTGNTWGHNAPKMLQGKERCTLLVHPEDAAGRGLKTGDAARVASRVGELTAPVEVSDEVMKGTVNLPWGFGHHYAGIRMKAAAKKPGVNVNILTDDAVIDELTGNACFTGIPVEVEAAK